MHRPPSSATGRALLVALVSLLAAAGCDLLNPFESSPTRPTGPDPITSLTIACKADVKLGTVSCDAPPSDEDGASRAVFGHQGLYVQVASANIALARTVDPAIPDTFAFDVTVQNLLNEALGTANGITPHANGVRIAFHRAPEATGKSDAQPDSVQVANADGQATVTGTDQDYFQYDGELLGADSILSGVIDGGAGETSGAKRWQIAYSDNVTAFSFMVIIDAAVEPLLAVNEVMANPNSAQDTLGEYVELINRGTFAVNLRGWFVQDGSSGAPAAAVEITDSLVVPGGSTALIGRVADGDLNGGIAPDFTVGTSFTTLALSNSAGGDFVRLRTPVDSVTVDSVSYTGSPTAGVSRERTGFGAGSANMNDGAFWTNAVQPYNGVDRGTPKPISGTVPGTGGGVWLSTSNPAQMPVGFDKSVFYAIRDSLGDSIPGTTVVLWESLTPATASVDSMGYVTGLTSGTATIRATASNGFTGTMNFNVVPATAANTANYLDHVEFGVPADATPGDEYDITRPQFKASYNPGRRSPNWVSWNMNASHFEQGGTNDVPRCNCFTDEPFVADSAKSYDWDYRGSGYDRGHVVQSESRTNTFQENAATFLLSNILPQAGANNQGPWLDLENYLGDLAVDSAKEIYTVAGGIYAATPPTLKDEGRVAIPDYTWKVALILDAGETLANVATGADLRVVAVRIPNLTDDDANPGDPNYAGATDEPSNIRNTDWLDWVVTVDVIEAQSGYDVFALLNNAIEDEVEARLGNAGKPVPVRLEITTEPSATATSGEAFAQQPVVRVVGSDGNTFPGTRSVTASLASGTGTLGGTVTVNTSSSGVVTFNNLSITGTGAHTLQFAATGLQGDTSSTVTVSLPVDVPPTVESTSPVNGATGVSTGTTITINFSEPVTATASAFALECPSATPIAFTVSGTGASRTLTPDANLPASTTCDVDVVASQVSDTDGTADAMASDYVFSFTTGTGVGTPAALVINEFIPNPAAVADTDGEWFEVHNPGGVDVDLLGWKILSGGGASESAPGHTIGSSVVVPAGGYVVLGVNGDAGTNGGITVNYVYSGITLANNTTDWLRLVNAGGDTVDEVMWGAAPTESASSPPTGASRELINPSLDNLYSSGASTNWRTSTNTLGSGDEGTPGAQNSVYVP